MSDSAAFWVGFGFCLLAIWLAVLTWLLVGLAAEADQRQERLKTIGDHIHLLQEQIDRTDKTVGGISTRTTMAEQGHAIRPHAPTIRKVSGTERVADVTFVPSHD